MTDKHTLRIEFAVMFPEEIDISTFDIDGFGARTKTHGKDRAEAIRQLAIWHSEEFPPTSLDAWTTLDFLYSHAHRLDADNIRIPNSKGVTALNIALVLDSTQESNEMHLIARGAFAEALRRDASDADSMYGLGLSNYFQHDGDISEAKQWFSRALATEPTMARARLYLGHCLQDEQRWSEALTEYRRVDRERLVEELQAWRTNKLDEQMGFCLMKLGQTEQALELFRSVLDAYERATPDALPDDLIGYPSELVDAATSELATELSSRVKNCLERHEWYSFYAHKFVEDRGSNDE